MNPNTMRLEVDNVLKGILNMIVLVNLVKEVKKNQSGAELQIV